MSTIIELINKWDNENEIFSDNFNDDVRKDFDYIYDNLPEDWFDLFLANLSGVFKCNLLKPYDDKGLPIDYITATCGWNTALRQTCEELGTEYFYEWYNELPWYVSDVFDGCMVDKILELNN